MSRDVTGLPGFLLGKEFFKKGVIELVSGFVDHDVTEDRHAEEGKIAEAIKDFMADELIWKPQAVFVDDPVFVDDDSVFQRPPQRQSVAFHVFNFVQETEGSGIGDFTLEQVIYYLETGRFKRTE